MEPTVPTATKLPTSPIHQERLKLATLSNRPPLTIQKRHGSRHRKTSSRCSRNQSTRRKSQLIWNTTAIVPTPDLYVFCRPSDKNENWVVDLLVVKDEVESSNEVFTDPNIVKVRYLKLFWVNRPSCFSQVFHGAESDVVWLQQDFNICIVNLFATFHPTKLLGQSR